MRFWLRGFACLLTVNLWIGCRLADGPKPPNVVLVMTDDQGYGDLGSHGNQLIRTPTLDSLATQSVELTHFYVSPVCAPTRASLMTGRYNYRTGVTDTYLGRAMMFTEEVTLAEILREAGYRTGIFGKWHLGDNYPLRPMEQGFDESLIHKGGGIGQPSDPPGNRYFDPILQNNGQPVHMTGYCTDIFFQATMDFIERNREQPFFAYLATNAPHNPLQIADEYVEPYLKAGLDERTAKVYGMVTNIDDNMAKLLSKLDELNLADTTILIFMTDNGPAGERYGAGLRGSKTTVFEGGIRVPFFVRWPGHLKAARRVDLISAHIDLVPTLLAACGLQPPRNVVFDGVNLFPVWSGASNSLPDRYLFFQSHRGEVPEMGRACAIRSQQYKLVQPDGWKPGPGPENPKWMLFDLTTDPGEQHDLAEARPDLVTEIRRAYVDWFEDVSSTRGFDPPRIFLGTGHENPVTLTRQDWRGPRASWAEEGLGHWEVRVTEDAQYEIRFRFAEAPKAGTAEFRLGKVGSEQSITRGATSVTFEPLELAKTSGRLEAILHYGESSVGVHYVDVTRLKVSKGP